MSALLPIEAAPLILALGGLALVVGARRIACALAGIAVAAMVVRPLVTPFLDMVPLWALAIFAFYAGVAMLRAVFQLFVGRTAANHAMGILAADFFKLFLKALFVLPALAVAGVIALLRAVVR